MWQLVTKYLWSYKFRILSFICFLWLEIRRCFKFLTSTRWNLLKVSIQSRQFPWGKDTWQLQPYQTSPRSPLHLFKLHIGPTQKAKTQDGQMPTSQTLHRCILSCTWIIHLRSSNVFQSWLPFATSKFLHSFCLKDSTSANLPPTYLV